MSKHDFTTNRLEAFSDGVIAIIITIMVLELKVPHEATLGAFLHIWPVFVSYALSYLMVAIYWVNHHHLMHYTKYVDNAVLWANNLLLFFLSLVPFFTAYVGENAADPFAAVLYTFDLMLCGISFYILRAAISRQFKRNKQMQEWNHSAKRKNIWAIFFYCCALAAAFAHVALCFLFIAIVGGMYFLPTAWLKPIEKD